MPGRPAILQRGWLGQPDRGRLELGRVERLEFVDLLPAGLGVVRPRERLRPRIGPGDPLRVVEIAGAGRQFDRAVPRSGGSRLDCCRTVRMVGRSIVTSMIASS